MVSFLIQKALRVILILFVVSLLTFLLMHAIPGNPLSSSASGRRVNLNLGFDPILQRELTRRFGLNLPLWRQYSRYLLGDFNEDGSFFCGTVCGNFGPSIQLRGRSVQNILFSPPPGQSAWQSKFGYSIRLVLFGALIASGLGIPLGILNALQPRSLLNRAISLGLAVLTSIPNFVLGLLAIIVLANGLKLIHVLPDWNNPAYWVLPAVLLAVMPMSSLARVTRSAMRNILDEDYIRTARAKGLSQRRVILIHGLRNAIIPIITFLGPALMEMVTGLLIVEKLFSFPGFGRQYWDSVLNLDYPMILGLTLIYALAIALLSLLTGVLAEALDPRMSSAAQQANA